MKKKGQLGVAFAWGKKKLARGERKGLTGREKRKLTFSAEEKVFPGSTCHLA